MTASQIKLLKQIISEHMNVVMQLTTGTGKKISASMLKKLGLPKDVSDLITDSYKYGKISTISGKSLQSYTPTQVDKLMKDMKLTPGQKQSIEYSQLKAQSFLDNLQTKITSSVVSLAVQEQMNMYETIKTVVPTAMENGTARYQVVQQLRETSGDWERDWNRVANTEMWDAKVNGEVEAILNGESPLTNKKEDTLVFKRPAPNACVQCKNLYLEPGTNKPRVFKLSDLIANGTNYGKKQSEWVATVGTVHPNCMCVLSILPDGYHLDDNGTIQPD